MATLYISEYATTGWTTASGLPCGQEPAITDQTAAIGVAVSSAPFQANTRFVRLHCDAICSVKFGVAGSTTAAVTSKRLNANQTEYFGVVGGQVVSVIANV